jgi:hypothetical protein
MLPLPSINLLEGGLLMKVVCLFVFLLGTAITSRTAIACCTGANCHCTAEGVECCKGTSCGIEGDCLNDSDGAKAKGSNAKDKASKKGKKDKAKDYQKSTPQ